jgi:hypothetical protein
MSENPVLLSALGMVLSKIDLDTSYNKWDLEMFILAINPTHGAASVVICTLAEVLSHPPYTPQHQWLGKSLSYLVGTTRSTRPLTMDEMEALRGVAAHHLE